MAMKHCACNVSTLEPGVGVIAPTFTPIYDFKIAAFLRRWLIFATNANSTLKPLARPVSGLAKLSSRTHMVQNLGAYLYFVLSQSNR